MEDRLPGFDQQIKSARHRLHQLLAARRWIADIGLEGKKIKKRRKMVDAFPFLCVGGAAGKYAAIARQIGYRAAAEDCPAAIENLLRAYLATREPGEDLRAYFARTGHDETLRAQLNGAGSRSRRARSRAGLAPDASPWESRIDVEMRHDTCWLLPRCLPCR